jgi:hypothetical protein
VIPSMVLVRLLIVALERLPDHRLVLDEATWDAMARKYGGELGGGLMLQETAPGAFEAKLADHEDRVVLTDKVRKAGGVLVEAGGLTFGIVPDTGSDDDGA